MGAIADVGMASRDPFVRRALRSKGIISFKSFKALEGLDYQLRNNIPEMVCYFL
jgi:hypothetical protein